MNRDFEVRCNTRFFWSYLYTENKRKHEIWVDSGDKLKSKVLNRNIPWEDSKVPRQSRPMLKVFIWEQSHLKAALCHSGCHGAKTIIKDTRGVNMPTTVTNEYLRKEFDNFEKNGEFRNLLEELKFSTLIVPIDVEQEGCAMIDMGGNSYIPLFTDIHEYQKVDLKGNFIPRSFEFNFYLELLQNGLHGFIVNVESERFPITPEFLEFIDMDYIFDQDYQPFTVKEIRGIYDSIDNSELEEFLKDDENRWDFGLLIDILLKSDLLTPVAANRNYDELAENGVISTINIEKMRYALGDDNCAILFSAANKINPPNRNLNIYAQLVNLPLFIDFVLKSDLAGIRLDDDITIPREFLIDFMKGFRSPSHDKYDDYVFLI